jgi:ABC-type uncharacterized transport system substrate-binding protein
MIKRFASRTSNQSFSRITVQALTHNMRTSYLACSERVYIVYNPKEQSPVLALKVVSESAAKLGVELFTREARTPEEIEIAFQDTPKEADDIFFCLIVWLMLV